MDGRRGKETRACSHRFERAVYWVDLCLHPVSICLCTALVCSSALGLDPQKLASQFTHTSWSAKDGIPGPVLAIAQPRTGICGSEQEPDYIGLMAFVSLVGSQVSANSPPVPRCCRSVPRAMAASGSDLAPAESVNFAMAG